MTTSRVCEDCSIAFPTNVPDCLICGQETKPSASLHPDSDWLSRVADFKANAARDEDKVIRWRFAELMRAGAPPRTAEAMAHDRHIDLHQACGLFRDAGPALAVRILL